MSAIALICLLLALALLTAWRDFRLGRHALAWSAAFALAAATSGLRLSSTLVPGWGEDLRFLSCITSIVSMGLLSWGFCRRAERKTRLVCEVAGFVLMLLAILWCVQGSGWVTACRLLTSMCNLALVVIALSSLKGARKTIRLGQLMFLMAAAYMVTVAVLAVTVGPDPGSVFPLTVAVGGPVVTVSLGILTLLITASDLAGDLRMQAWTDPLTGLLNRRGFEQRIAEMKASRPLPEPFVVVVADLDHFKTVNDTLGHAAGDAVLRCFARQISSALGGQELAARIGGEEFIFVLPGTPPAEGLARVERMRQSVPASLQDLGGSHQITASFGLTALRGGERLEEAIARADLALYRSKREGRNRVSSDEAVMG
ncbi:GGDEF domain-containing protein [Falsirhodobacter sp. 20TX0035]|uniref:GGDEF domain-containing protein n=1 Tax=Falsirhodobacter sp. 20TX0035 TaxID=3022019 RepID=UPI00232CFF81|nr:GGDEF domain-containing protein [Falsirhodobacter sp. 20TX0035]MDB6452916.1 GGDEF domain-containing protein [Falsirhodobacter sp. 20TX0035]